MNDVTGKIVDSIKDFDDLKEYSNAQYATIVAQSKKITELERKLEATESKLLKSEQTNVVNSTLSKDQDIKGSDAENICLIQLALLFSNAKLGELTLEETKKVEIYAKTLQLLKGKNTDDKKKEDSGKRLSNEELIALMNTELKEQ